MYVGLARSIWTDVDHSKVDKEVRRFRTKHHGLSNDELVEKLIRTTALRCGAVGAVASAPPGFLAVLPLAADFSYQVLALNRLVLTIARIYGRPTTREQRAATVGASLALGGGAEFLRRSIVKTVTRGMRKQAISRLMPAAGAVIGGALSYTSVIAIGRQAQDYYRRRTLVPRLKRAARK
jgi:uncharacterized protein (DUF697 family)